MEFKGVVSMEFYKPFQRNSTENGFLWKSMETFPWNSMEITKDISMEFHGNHKRHFRGIPWKCMERFPWNFVECFHGIPWKLCPNPPWNSMEIFSMEMHGQISLEFHGNQCPNPPWNSMEDFPWNSMEFHGIPWRYFTREVTHSW